MKESQHFILSKNHRRSLSNTLMIVEKLLLEISKIMETNLSACCRSVNVDVDKNVIKENQKLIQEALEMICALAEKYKITIHEESLRSIIDVKKSRIWEILCDSYADKLKGFGTFPEDLRNEYDQDIDRLLTLTNQLKL